jgi:hypothetical protein
MILWHPCYDPAIVLTNALDTDGSFFLLALSAFCSRVFAMATATSLAHLESIFGSEVLATSFDRASAGRWDGGCEGGRGLKVDVIWVVIHPDAGWASGWQAGVGLGFDGLSGARLSATTAQRRRDSPFGVIITHTFHASPLKFLPFSVTAMATFVPNRKFNLHFRSITDTFMLLPTPSHDSRSVSAQ